MILQKIADEMVKDRINSLNQQIESLKKPAKEKSSKEEEDKIDSEEEKKDKIEEDTTDVCVEYIYIYIYI